MTTRRAFLAQSAALVRAAAPPRPNVVFVLMDDLRWDDIGLGGHPWIKTPNIDRIGREGIVFRGAFAATPLCSPNRASFLTGQYAHSHGIIDNTDRSPRSHQLVTFPRILHDHGYEAAYIGKWHMGIDDSPRPGFDYWLSLQGQGYYFDPDLNENGERLKVRGYTTDIFNERATRFIRRQRTRPFLLFLAHKAVHPNIFQNADGSVRPSPTGEGPAAFPPAARHRRLYAAEKLPRRPNYLKAPEGKPALLRGFPGVPPLSPATATEDEVIRNRLRMLASADEGVGALYHALEETGQLDRTVFVFTSDEGYFYGEHCLGEERRLAYEESIRVPLLIRYPALVQPGRTEDRMAVSVDLAPTLLELAGAPGSAGVEGRSLVPLLTGHARQWRNSILIEYFSDTVMKRIRQMGYQAVRTERWKYIQYTELKGMDELYDLKNDPYELRNLADDPAAAREKEALGAELARLLRPGAPAKRHPKSD